ncbi:hypothetical protein Pan241w_53840 [Gimesia alba]|uniref:DUF4174 domain-containing protein n=1 Tax=Gimesia alba TaxID=2527973 RepID=A0A517RN32_9PLAN|nr:hypothetical protein [Gimesia alba]QDT45264.1 hypothetical protein Pan241w_53840 [Gimesia alba]
MKFSKKKQLRVTGVVILCGFIGLILFQTFQKPDRIQWRKYSVTQIQNDLAHGKLILVSVMASWSHGTIMHEARYSEDPLVLKLIQTYPITCYQVDLAKIPGEQIDTWRNYFQDVSGLGLLLLTKNSRDEIVLRRLLADKITGEIVVSEIEQMLAEPTLKARG